MNKLLGFIAWMVVWFSGTAVFVYWLELTGVWLMGGGALTYILAEVVEELIESILK